MSLKLFLQITISLAAIALLTTHVLKPNLAVDEITVALLAVGIIPWLGGIFKKIELPGGGAIEYQDLEKKEEAIKDVGLLNERARTKKADLISMPLPSDDPNLTLVWLRIEIEKRIRKIAEKNMIEYRFGLRNSLEILKQKKIITGPEVYALEDLTRTLNSAAHGVNVEPRAAEWALENGPKILSALDKILSSKGKRF